MYRHTKVTACRRITICSLVDRLSEASLQTRQPARCHIPEDHSLDSTDVKHRISLALAFVMEHPKRTVCHIFPLRLLVFLQGLPLCAEPYLSESNFGRQQKLPVNTRHFYSWTVKRPLKQSKRSRTGKLSRLPFLFSFHCEFSTHYYVATNSDL
jgi:hypothetical protein